MVKILELFDSLVEIVGRKNVAWVLVSLSLVLFVVNYPYYSDSLQENWQIRIKNDDSGISYFIVFYEMLTTYLEHIRIFFYNFYLVHLQYLSLDNLSGLGKAISHFTSEYSTYFLNVFALTLMSIAIYIRTNGSFIKRLKAPFRITIYITTLVIFLTYFADKLKF